MGVGAGGRAGGQAGAVAEAGAGAGAWVGAGAGARAGAARKEELCKVMPECRDSRMHAPDGCWVLTPPAEEPRLVPQTHPLPLPSLSPLPSSLLPLPSLPAV